MAIRDSRKGKLLILTGVPASGKTTVAGHLAKMVRNVIIVSSDEIRKVSRRRVWEKMEEIVSEQLEGGMVVVADATNYDRSHRDRFARAAIGLDCPFRIVYLKAERDTLLERNSKRNEAVPQSAIYHLFRAYQEPLADEMPIIIDTESVPARDAARVIAAQMGLDTECQET